MRALFDVNVLVALFDPHHSSHASAIHWFDQHGASGWASCPITQNGCLRVMSQPGYANQMPVTDVYLLARAVEHGGRLVTFDQGISLAAVVGAQKKHLVVL